MRRLPADTRQIGKLLSCEESLGQGAISPTSLSISRLAPGPVHSPSNADLAFWRRTPCTRHHAPNEEPFRTKAARTAANKSAHGCIATALLLSFVMSKGTYAEFVTLCN